MFVLVTKQNNSPTVKSTSTSRFESLLIWTNKLYFNVVKVLHKIVCYDMAGYVEN